MQCSESILNLSVSGFDQKIGVKTWTESGVINPEFPTLLALHGWLDNAATFDLLSLQLSSVNLIAVDLPGHGLSSHRAPGAEYYIWSYIEDVLAVIGALQLDQFVLLGHSMGGAISCLFASLYPEKVKALILLDALGPLATSDETAPAQMRKALMQKQFFKARPLRFYASKEAAIEARMKKGLKTEAATLLGQRGISHSSKGYFWHSDSRLARLNLLSMTETQVFSFLQGISCPSFLVAAAGLVKRNHHLYQKRLPYIKGLEVLELEGSHHQHLEGKVNEVASGINSFLASRFN